MNRLAFIVGLVVATDAFAQAPRIVPPAGHVAEVTHVAIAADERYLVTASRDRTVQVWSLPEVTLLEKIDAPDVSGVAVAPDTGTVAIGDENGLVRLVNPRADVAVGEIRLERRIAALAWSRRIGAFVAAAGSALFEVRPESTVAKSLVRIGSTVEDLAFTGDGSGLVVRTAMDIRIVDAGRWEVITTPALAGLRASSITMQPDGDVFVVVARDGTISRWSATSRTLLGEVGRVKSFAPIVAFVSRDTLLINDGTTPTLQSLDGVSRPLEVRPAMVASSVATSRSGLVVTGDAGGDIIAWPKGVEGREKRVRAPEARVTGIFRQAGRLWVSTDNRDRGILSYGALWQLAGEALGMRAYGTVLAVLNEWKGRAGTWMASQGFGGLAIRNVDDPATADHLEVEGEIQALSSHGRWAITLEDLEGSNNQRVVTWDLRSGKRRVLPVAPGLFTATFGPDPDVLAIARWRSLAAGPASATTEAVVELWNLARWRRVVSLSAPITLRNRAVLGLIATWTFSRDGSRAAVAYTDGSIRTWNVRNGRVEHTFQGHDAVSALRYSADATQLAVGRRDGNAYVIDAGSGAIGTRFAGGGWETTALEFDDLTGMLLVGNAAGVLTFHEARTGTPLGQLHFRSMSGDWLLTTPDGLFDGSDGSWGDIRWRFDDGAGETVPVESYFHDYFYPGLLGEIVRNAAPPVAAPFGKLDRQTPRLTLRMPSAKEWTSRVAPIEIVVEGIEAHDVRLFRNGVLVRQWSGATPAGAVLRADVTVVAGDNELAAYAFNRDNVRSAAATGTLAGAPGLRRPGNLYVVAIGIEKYRNPDYELTFAADDAVLVADRLSEGRKNIRRFAGELADELAAARRVNARIDATRVERVEKLQRLAGEAFVTRLLDGDATRARILQEIERVARTAQPEDAVVIFFAGHGIADGSRYYLLPVDFESEGPRAAVRQRGMDAIRANAVSDEDLHRILEPLQAEVSALIIDACESGQAIDTASDRRRGPINSKGLGQLAYEKGMYLLAGAQSYQSAVESGTLGHGLLTHTLVNQALTLESVFDQDFEEGVTLAQALTFVAQHLGNGEQVVPATTAATPTSTGTQQPRLHRRRIPEESPVLLALSPFAPSTALPPVRRPPLH